MRACCKCDRLREDSQALQHCVCGHWQSYYVPSPDELRKRVREQRMNQAHDEERDGEFGKWIPE